MGTQSIMENEELALCTILIELALCWGFAMFADYTGESIGAGLQNESDRVRGTHPRKHIPSTHYYMFQDVHFMVVVGFGFVATFLKRYGYRSVVLNMLVAVITLQWATLCQGFFHMHQGKIHISTVNMLNADFASAAAFISLGAVIGLTTPLQLIVMVICQIPLIVTNEHIALEILQVSDVGASMLVHVFGAYFGLMVSFVLKRNSTPEKENASTNTSDIFLIIGTIFLWLFWPSFNASFAEGDAQHRAVINTYYSLAASTVVTLAVSSHLVKSPSFNMINIQNSALAGGVAIGTAADMMIQPFGAMIVGGIAGVVSIFSLLFIAPRLSRKLGVRDPCGVHSLHGLPGIVAAFVGAVAATVATDTDYHYSLYRQFPARTPLNYTQEYWAVQNHMGNIKLGLGRSALAQGAYQIAALGTTLAIAIAGGLITGLVLRLPVFSQVQGNQVINDELYGL